MREDMQLRPHQQRILDVLQTAAKGCVYCPTGGGKTLAMTEDLKRRLSASERPLTVVVTAPRILLAVQLYEEFTAALNGVVDAAVMHVHSGEVDCFVTTKVSEIQMHDSICRVANVTGIHQLIFTTYHSLGRIVDSGINIDVAYFDEAHNATQKSHFVGVAGTSMSATNAYFFTATPRYSRNSMGRGMNNTLVFGNDLINVPAPELMNNGSIIPPVVESLDCDETRTKHNAHEVDRNNVLKIIDSVDGAAKILVAAPSTRLIWNMLSQTNLLHQLKQRGYDVLHITSKHGAYVNQTKVGREEFFNTLTAWGKDSSRKFVLFHYSILSEGINVPGLTHTILLRQLPVIEMAQTIGRVIRLDRADAEGIASGAIIPGKFEMYNKPCGKVIVPLHSKGAAATIKRLQAVVDCIFTNGMPAIGYIND